MDATEPRKHPEAASIEQKARSARFAEELVRSISAQPDVALARLWLGAEDAPELELVASAGRSVVDPTQDWSSVSGRFRRLTRKTPIVGRVLVDGRRLVIEDMASGLAEADGREWAASETIVGAAVESIEAPAELRGILAVFFRGEAERTKERARWVSTLVASTERSVRELARVRHNEIILGQLERELAQQRELVEELRAVDGKSSSRILTEAEIRELEKDNALEALRRAHGRVHGPDGAAQLLQMKPTTLASRIKKWGIERVHRRAKTPE